MMMGQSGKMGKVKDSVVARGAGVGTQATLGLRRLQSTKT